MLHLPWRFLTRRDASLIKGLIVLGESRQSVARILNVRVGRIDGVLSGDKHLDVPPLTAEDLPPDVASMLIDGKETVVSR